MKILKIILITIGAIILIPILFIIGILSYDSYQESKFINIDIPKEMNFEKPKMELKPINIDSIKQDKIEITGNGYGGYRFYMWHKPKEEGELYVKAIELTQNISLSQPRLQERTKNIINGKSDKYQLFQGESLIYEGTFENYYPVRFEMWFKSKGQGIEKKLAEKKHLIDGWDR